MCTVQQVEVCACRNLPTHTHRLLSAKKAVVGKARIAMVRHKVPSERTTAMGAGSTVSVELSDGLVTEEWLIKYAIHACIMEACEATDSPNELAQLQQEAHSLARKLLDRLRSNGIYSVRQLESLSRSHLNEVLNCMNVEQKLQESFDRKAANHKERSRCSGVILALSGTLESMEANCVNYGLTAALVLTMTFNNFSSITKDDWDAYKLQVELNRKSCQAFAVAQCSDAMKTSSPLAYGESPYCYDALARVIANPFHNLTAFGQECCIDTIKCVAEESWVVETSFAIGNGGGTALLLLVVLYTSWLYIAIYGSSANRSRWTEQRLLVNELAGEMFILQILFFFSMMFSYIGIYSVISMKVTTQRLSSVSAGIVSTSGIMACFFLTHILRVVRMIDWKVDRMRSKDLQWSKESLQQTMDKNQQESSLAETTPSRVEQMTPSRAEEITSPRAEEMTPPRAEEMTAPRAEEMASPRAEKGRHDVMRPIEEDDGEVADDNLLIQLTNRLSSFAGVRASSAIASTTPSSAGAAQIEA